jgi:dimethylargininase
MFKQAIVRLPGANFAQGLTTMQFGVPAYAAVLDQHARYCAALEQCGLTLVRLEADEEHPDSTFVEDTAILTEHCAILTRPGAPSREGEVARIAPTIARFYSRLHAIESPGTLDGGDICDADGHFFIGLSERTNAAGAQQLAHWLAQYGYTSVTVDIHGVSDILHLKSGLAYLGDKRLVVIDALADHPAFNGYTLVRIAPDEAYAANCVRVNDYVLLAAGYPAFQATLAGLGYALLALDMSEYKKMDGGLSCLSLRF